MDSIINVNSEIGRLKRVMLHRPGREIENLVPEYLGRLLFDDIPYLKVAREEHDEFAKVLTDNGVEVLYLEELVAEAINDESIKNKFIDEFLKESEIVSPVVYRALKEHLISMSTRDMVDVMMAGVRKEAIEVKGTTSLSEVIGDDYPFFLDPMPNMYFMRDPAASIGKGLTISRMRTEARKRETLFIKYIHKYHPIFKKAQVPLWYDRNINLSLEGGDELVLSDKVIAIGCSERTRAESIEILAKNLFEKEEGYEKILVFDIPKCRAFMHLDTVFTMVDYDKFTIHPGIEGPLNVYEITRGSKGNLNVKNDTRNLQEALKKALGLSAIEFIKCGGGDRIIASREQWNDGSNTLAIAPGVVITYERNYITNEILDRRGIKVLPIRSSELSRGRGGPRCMSMPLERENIL